jgi:hypothetical protein
MIRTTEQNRRLHALLNKLGLGRHDLPLIVSSTTAGRTTKSSEMTATECESLINKLNAYNDERDRKRKRVISHLAEAGYITPAGKPDMKAIEAWALQQKYKTPLNQLTSAQLSELIYAADAVRRHFLNGIRP